MSRASTAAAFVEVQISRLTAPGQPPLDDASAIAGEMLEFVAYLPTLLGDVLLKALDELEHNNLAALAVPDRAQLLGQLWNDSKWRTRLAQLARLGWLVIYSRPPARNLVGFKDPRQFAPGDPTVDVPKPAPAPLDGEYDVCVVGSGAGGSVVAARLAEAGKKVLIVEQGKWVSPRDLPTRDDRALEQLYRNAGVNPALPDEVKFIIQLITNQPATINVLQPRVVGGGPFVNNAILLEMAQSTWQLWATKYDFPIAWQPIADRMALVAQDLGRTPPGTAAGPRSAYFRQGAAQLGQTAADLPLAVYNCLGCGGCNVGCRFGRKTGGVHGPRPAGAPRSYLERALAAGAVVRPEIEAVKFSRGGFLSNRVGSLVAHDLAAAGQEVKIRARVFVVAAGPIASSLILTRSLPGTDCPPGTNISANVVTPLFAVGAASFSGNPDPGIQMCYYVDPGGNLLIESWFHYPASLSIAIPGWLDEHVATMRSYSRLASAGVVVASKPSGRLGALTDLVLELDTGELDRLKQGVVQLAGIYFAAGAETVIPSTTDPLPIRRAQQQADTTRFLTQVTSAAHLNLNTAHPQGGNRMGRHSGSSVVDPTFRIHDVDNLFVADASLFPAGCGVNPQLTVMALASLAADQIAKKLS